MGLYGKFFGDDLCRLVSCELWLISELKYCLFFEAVVEFTVFLIVVMAKITNYFGQVVLASVI